MNDRNPLYSLLSSSYFKMELSSKGRAPVPATLDALPCRLSLLLGALSPVAARFASFTSSSSSYTI